MKELGVKDVSFTQVSQAEMYILHLNDRKSLWKVITFRT